MFAVNHSDESGFCQIHPVECQKVKASNNSQIYKYK